MSLLKSSRSFNKIMFYWATVIFWQSFPICFHSCVLSQGRFSLVKDHIFLHVDHKQNGKEIKQIMWKFTKSHLIFKFDLNNNTIYAWSHKETLPLNCNPPNRWNLFWGTNTNYILYPQKMAWSFFYFFGLIFGLQLLMTTPAYNAGITPVAVSESARL